MGYDEQAYPTKKHRADSRAAGSGQQLELGMSEKEGNQQPSSASGHGQDTVRTREDCPAEAKEAAGG